MREKEKLRARMKKKRAELSASEKREWDLGICKAIAASDCFRRADTVLLYVPKKTEINLLPLSRLAIRMGKRVAFPRCDEKTHGMIFCRWNPEDGFVPGPHGIMEPPPEAEPVIPSAETLCVVPALTFDPSGNRLGYGGGYYDRFLREFPGICVGAVYTAMICRSVPAEKHDIPVRILFTEKAVYAVKNRNDRTPSSHFTTEGASAPSDSTGETSDSTGRASAEKKTAFSAFLFAVKQWGSQALCAVKKGWAYVRTPEPVAGEGTRPVRPLHLPPLLVLCTFLLLLLFRIPDLSSRGKAGEYAGVIFSQILVFLIPSILYCQLRGQRFSQKIRIRPIRPEHIRYLLCTLILMITGSLLLSILTGGIASLEGNFTLYSVFVARLGGSVTEGICAVIAYGLLPAFCEELLYRSILCAEYERYGAGVAIAVSAFFFSLLHFSFANFLTYLFLGALLAAALYATRSFFAVFSLHLLYNLFCLFGQPYLSAFYVNAGSNEIFLFCLITLFLLFAAFFSGEARKVYHVYARANADSSYTVPLPVRRLPITALRAILTPEVGICLVFWLVLCIVG